MHRKKVLFLVLGILIGSIVPFFALHAATNQAEIDVLNKQIEERRAKVKELEQNIEAYKKQADQKMREATSLSNQVSLLDNRISQVQLDVDATQNKLEGLQLEIEVLSLGIEDKEAVITKQKKMVAEFIRNISKRDTKSYVEIMAMYQSFASFYNQVQYLEKIDRDLGKSVRALRIAREELSKQKQVAVERHTAFERLQDELNQKKKDLGEEIVYKQDLLGKTKSSEASYRTLISSLKQQYQSTESEIEGIEQQVRKKLEADKQFGQLPSNAALAWPTNGRYLTALFHDPEYPFRNVFEHNAVDIRAAHGTAVHAAGSGYVARAKRCSSSSCYSYVMLIHSGGIATVYGHLSQITVKDDQFVTVGDTIGLSGGTPGTVGAGPFVTGPHLHFEVRKDGIPVNPLSYLPK